MTGHRARLIIPWLVLVCAGPLLAATARAQGGAEIVRGRVLTPDGVPVPNALVTVMGLGTRTEHSTHSDETGLYTVLFGDGEGAYLVTARVVGFAPRTVRVSRVTESDVLVADLTLSPAPAVLDTVRVMAGGAGSEDSSIGGSTSDALNGALFSLDPADLNALAANVPGVLAIPGVAGADSFSVLGASPDQNSIIVDGMRFGGSTLPPDALASATLITTSFDPGRGQFAGGQLSIHTRRGGNTFGGSMRAQLADPHLAWTDPASPTTLPQSLSASGGAGGPIIHDRLFYYGAFELRRSANDLRSLLSDNDPLLDQYGLERDSVDALASTLADLDVPLTTGAVPDDRVSNRYLGSLRFDFTPDATTSLTLRGNGTWRRSGGGGISAFGFPSSGDVARSSDLSAQLSFAKYSHGFTDDLSTSLEREARTGNPYLRIPHGSVRVSTAYDDGREGLRSLDFGGGNDGAARSTALSWETRNEFSWISHDSKHHLRLGQMIEYERHADHQASPAGEFTFQSLSDLAAGRPASYSRMLSARDRSSNAVSGAVWIADEWRKSRTLQFEYGLRLDAARSSVTPAYNPAVDSLFGIRTDGVPRDVEFSPRVGFSWRLNGAPNGSEARQSALRPSRPLTLSGGVGAFRGVISPERIAQLVDATGLANSIRRLVCVGDATPIPDWSLYTEDAGAVPSTCLDGTAPVEFSTDQPDVRVYDPSFRAPVSWRGNLNLNGLAVHGWRIGLGATVSLEMNRQSTIDRNLRRTIGFTLPEEGNRPVYVDPVSIVPATGEVAPGASRISTRFDRVTTYLSDLRSLDTQLSITLSPQHRLFGKLPVSLTYTLSRDRAQRRGFDGLTAGDPFAIEWAAGGTPTHMIRARTELAIKWLTLALRVTATSGTPYTPRVAGDLNGDGQQDDRAFIFDPATASDPALSAAMASLLASAPERARNCLARQLGKVAARNSCRTGWRVQPDLNLGIGSSNNGLGVFDGRLRLTLTTRNAMAALLRVSGLSNTALGRVTRASAPDPTLLYVDGFDPATRQFHYRVNQQFGDERDRRFAAPFQVQVGLDYRLGGPSRHSLARRLGLSRSRHAPVSRDSILQRLRNLTANPVARIVALHDTLALTSDQRARMQALSDSLQHSTDSVLAPLVDYMVQRGGDATDSDLQRRLARLVPQLRALMRASLQRAAAALTGAQRQKLPPYMREMLAKEHR
ncbi:MAG TPA: carboxypeptidase regulatory-like domain-containing protein [Gemmatimonadaceae bacterium]|nr:carboxypeptidase regulatory-like domain-containing protein [Gemmatimonadaceae bacterium]